jgi:hypothetical protein
VAHGGKAATLLRQNIRKAIRGAQSQALLPGKPPKSYQFLMISAQTPSQTRV